MPELPDITVYIEALEKRILGHTLQRVRIAGPFLLRTATPPADCFQGHQVAVLRRIGKRIALGFDNGHWLVLHLMIAGRLHWKTKAVVPDGRRTLAAFEFDNGTLTLTEAGSQKRASLHLFASEEDMRQIDPGGLEVLTATPELFAAAITSENHTLKRSLTDPRLFSGIGNAYSDEILFHAHLSPVQLTQRLDAPAIERLYRAVKATMTEWIVLLRKEAGEKFPEDVTAFRDEMYVHGRYGQPCKKCGVKIQRIRYASNETNYCPNCQTGGKLLADRALSRLLREDWPRSLDELDDYLASKRSALQVKPTV
jgi:formamidopyrimidine-DNA glycosylase